MNVILKQLHLTDLGPHYKAIIDFEYDRIIYSATNQHYQILVYHLQIPLYTEYNIVLL